MLPSFCCRRGKNVQLTSEIKEFQGQSYMAVKYFLFDVGTRQGTALLTVSSLQL